MIRGHIAPVQFQSTPPARGATNLYSAVSFFFAISIHAPREGGDIIGSKIIDRTEFQSTPPARGATAMQEINAAYERFQSTPPARGATLFNRFHLVPRQISIHAPREGGATAAGED